MERAHPNRTSSTGPRTRAGKAIARLNARRHGLASRLSPEALAHIEHAAMKYVGTLDDPYRIHFARIVARADFEIEMVQKVRHHLIGEGIRQQRGANWKEIETRAMGALLPQLLRLERYEGRARSCRAKAIQFL